MATAVSKERPAPTASTKLEKLKELLANIPLLRWVRAYGADGLQEGTAMAKSLGVRTTKETLMLLNSSNTTCLYTDAKVTGEKHLVLSASLLYDVLHHIPELSQGNVLIMAKPSQPAFLVEEDRRVVVVIAPRAADNRDDDEDEANHNDDEEEDEDMLLPEKIARDGS